MSLGNLYYINNINLLILLKVLINNYIYYSLLVSSIN